MKTFITFFTILFFQSISFAQLSTKQIDSLVEKSMQTFHVPGMAVSVVKDGKVIHSKGYGISSITTNNKVDENTLFGIASNSKAFTAAALAILIDQEKLNWDDKVIKYLPDFKMYDEYVTNEFTIRDLLTHRSGLGLGAGDLMLFPSDNLFTKEEIIHNLRYLNPTTSFRTQFDYDNLLYIVAGEIVTKITNLSWAEFVEVNIFNPLKMKSSRGNFYRIKDTTNTVSPHLFLDKKYVLANRDESKTLDAAGGIYASIDDLNKWIMTLLNNGEIENEKSLFSEKRLDEMWSPQTILSANPRPPYNTHFSAYGLGWFLKDTKGYKEIGHTGGLEGMVTEVVLIPELNLGIIVLTNQQSGLAFRSISNSIKDAYLNIPNQNWVTLYEKYANSNDVESQAKTIEIWNVINKNKNTKESLSKLVGKYKDNWFGEIEIVKKGKRYYFESKKSPTLIGEVFYYKDNVYVVKWNNRKMNADAFIDLIIENNSISLKMKPISEETDFSYDFQDLDLKKIEE